MSTYASSFTHMIRLLPTEIQYKGMWEFLGNLVELYLYGFDGNVGVGNGG